MYNSFTNSGDVTSGAEKKTRKSEDNADLLALLNGVSLSGEARRRYLYDNVDVAQVVDFLAARALTGDTDCCHKNYYFYRDTGRSDEWQMWPWDVDLSFGRRWISSMTYWDQHLIANTPLFIGSGNRVPQAIFETPEMRQSTFAGTNTHGRIAHAAGTPKENLHYEPRIDELAALIGPTRRSTTRNGTRMRGATDRPRRTSAAVPPSRRGTARFVPAPSGEDNFFNRLAPGASEIPDAQPTVAAVQIAGADCNPASGNQDEEYVKLTNLNSFAVDVSGWTLAAGVNPATPLFIFRGGTVIPAGGTLYVAASRPAFRARRTSPKGGQSLFVVGDYAGRLPDNGVTLSLTDRHGLKVASARVVR
jgi:hypothetical protein